MNKELREFLDAHYQAEELRLVRLHDALRRYFTKNSQPVRGALALPIGATDKAKTILSNSDGRLMGWAIKEATGAASAEIALLDGTNVDGDLLAPITLSAGQSSREWFGPAGVSFGAGLFVQTVSGAVTGTVWLGAVDL